MARKAGMPRSPHAEQQATSQKKARTPRGLEVSKISGTLINDLAQRTEHTRDQVTEALSARLQTIIASAIEGVEAELLAAQEQRLEEKLAKVREARSATVPPEEAQPATTA